MKNTTQQAAWPVYVMQESDEEVQIVYNMKGAKASDIELLLSQDGRRLHVVGKKFFADCTDEFLWTFKLPKSVDSTKIEIQRREDFYLVLIPKRRRWPRFQLPSFPNLVGNFAPGF